MVSEGGDGGWEMETVVVGHKRVEMVVQRVVAVAVVDPLKLVGCDGAIG